MFRTDSSPGALSSYSTGYPSPGFGLLTRVPTLPFLTTQKTFDSHQMESFGMGVSTIRQNPSSYSEPARFHTVSTVSIAEPWGTSATHTAPYRVNQSVHYQKHPYVYHPRAVSLAPFHPSSYCDYPQEPKPTQSYIGLIAIAILSSPDKKLVLSDIYKYILDHYAYFRCRGPGWRNSIRHNLSLNECFIKSNRSSNGKGHFWAIHPANVDDFTKGDFRRRRAQRKVRKYLAQKRTQIEVPVTPDVDVKENDVDDAEDECESIIDVDNFDNNNDDTDQCDDDNDYQLEEEKLSDTENLEDLEQETEVMATVPSESLATYKPSERRGAFDMDTILSTNFPCKRETPSYSSQGREPQLSKHLWDDQKCS